MTVNITSDGSLSPQCLANIIKEFGTDKPIRVYEGNVYRWHSWCKQHKCFNEDCRHCLKGNWFWEP